MNKTLIKVISLILCVAMVLTFDCAGITTAFAASNDKSQQTNLSTNADDADSSITTTIEGEESEEVDENDTSSSSPEPSPTVQPESSLETSPTIEPTLSPSNETSSLEPVGIPQPDSQNKLSEEKDKEYLEQAKRENKPIQITELCDEYTTVFQNPDGTRTVYAFSSPVRYEGTDGKLVDIDSQIITASDENKLEGYEYVNKSGYVDVYLPNDLVSDIPVALNYDQYQVEIQPINKTEITLETEADYTGKLEQETVDLVGNEIEFTTENEGAQALTEGTAFEIDASIEYKSGFGEQIRLQYTPLDNGIKEDIILNEYTGQNQFDFTLSLTGLKAKQTDDGNIVLYDSATDEPIFYLPEMYMKDSFTGDRVEGDGHYSEEVKYALKEGAEEGQYVVSVIADKEFLSKETTVYPVIIDPTIQTITTQAGIIDAYVRKDTPTTKYNGGGALKVGWPDSDGLCRSYIQFPSLPSLNGAIISSASLFVKESTGYTSAAYVTVNRVADTWVYTSLDWSHQPLFDTAPEPGTETLVDHAGDYTFNITRMVNGWYTDTSGYWDEVQRGCILKLNATQEPDNSSARKYRCFRASEDSSTDTPYLIINYSLTPATPGVSVGYEPQPDGRGYIIVNCTDMAGAAEYYIYNGDTQLGSSASPSNIKIYLNPGTYSNIRYKARNQYEMYSSLSSGVSVTVVDRMTPYQPTINSVTVTPGDISSGKYNSIAVTFQPVTDRPTGSVSYRLLMGQDGTNFIERTDLAPVGNTFIVTQLSDGTALPDNTTYYFEVRAYDSASNFSTSVENHNDVVYDRTGPTGSFSITPSSPVWTKDNPTISWSNLTDTPSGVNGVQYKINEGEWISIEDSNTASGSFELPALTNSGIYTIYVHGIDNVGNISENVSALYNFDNDVPGTIYNLSATVTNGVINSGDSAAIGITFDAAEDNPEGDNSGIALYEIEKSIDNGQNYSVAGSTTETNFELTNQPDNTSYKFRVRAKDSAGNYSDWVVSDSIFASDRTSPSAPATIAIIPNDWTNDTTPLISWEAIQDGEGHLYNAQYKINDADWVDIDTSSGVGTGSIELDFSSHNDGEYTISIRGKDAFNNTGDAGYVIYKKDTTAPQILSIISPDESEIVSTLVDVVGTAADDRLSSWILDFGVGEEPGIYTYLMSGTNSINPADVLYVWNTENLTIGQEYTIRLRVYDTAGNVNSTTRTIVKGNDPNPVISASLQIDSPTYVASEADTDFTFQKSNNGGNSGLTGKLYINGVLVGTENQPGDGFTVNMTQYAEGEIQKFFIESEDASHNLYYSSKTQTDNILNDALDNSNNLSGMDSLTLSNGSISLEQSGGVYASSGYFTTNSIPVCSETFRLTVSRVETLPSLTSITFEYSTDGGTTWYSLPEAGVMLNGVSQVKIKGILSTQDSAVTPTLDSVTVNSMYFIGQQTVRAFLVDAPDSLSTRANVNHTILLRWDASTTQNATYNIYRSTSEQGEYSLVANNVTGTFWYDYNLYYEQTFYYKVKAVALVNSLPRESVATNIAHDTMVDENEIDQYIGSKPYWDFISFSTGSGDGEINTVSGNLYYQTIDFSQYSPGMGMNIVRTFNSEADYRTPLGEGWDFGYNIILLKEFDTQGAEIAMILKAGDGTLYRFAKTETGYESPLATYMDLNYDTGTGKYSITIKGGTVYQFNEKLMIESVTDNNGNTISMGYDGRGNLITLGDEVGDVISFEYSYNLSGIETDKLIKVIDLNDVQSQLDNVEYHYVYDEVTGMLKEAYIWLDAQETDKYGETYEYYVDGSIQTVINPAGEDTQISYTCGKVTGVTNAINEVMSVGYSVGYTTCEFRNAMTRYDYDDPAVSGIMLVTRVTDALGHYTDFGYDSNLSVDSITYLNRVGLTDNVEVSSGYHYDDDGNLMYSVRPDGRTTYYQDETHPYNEFGESTILKVPYKLDEQNNVVYAETTYEYYPTTGNLKKVTGPLGHTTEYTYDAFGNVLTQISTVNGIVSTTTYQYDSKGRLVKTIFTDNTETEQGYDVYDYVKWTEDAEGVRTSYNYDIIGRLITIIHPGEDGSITTDDITEINQYDKNNNVIRHQYSDTVTLYTYDDIGRALTTISTYGTPDQCTDSISYGAPDANGGYTVTSTDGDGVQYTTTYDALGRAIRSECGDTWAETVYDNTGQVIQTTDNTGEICKSEFDILGRTTTSIVDWGDSSHKNYTSTYGYDLAGNCTTQTDASGCITETEYDFAARPTYVQITDTSTDPDTVTSESYTYDAVYDGKVQGTVTDSLGHVTVYAYNPTGTLASETDKGDLNTTEEMVISYTYDDNDRLLTQTMPDNSVIAYEYFDNGYLKKTSYSASYFIEYTYDDNGNQLTMTKTKDGETEINEWQYDAQGRVKTVLLNNTIVVKYKYTTAGYLSETWYPEGEDWRVTKYTYNDDGTIEKIYDATNSQDMQLIREYVYTDGEITSLKDYRKFDQTNDDGDYSLQEFESYPDGSLKIVKYSDVDMENGQVVSTTQRERYELTYNNDGNIHTEDIDLDYGSHVDVLKDYEYSSFGWLKTETVNNVETTYDYDDVGNRKSMATSSGTVYYKYDEFNQLTQTASDDQFLNLITTFDYDDRGNQTTQTDIASDTVTTYDYDAADLLVDVKVQVGQDPQQTIAEYLYDGAGQRIQKTEGESTTRFYYDGLTLLYTDDGTSQKLEENIIEPDGSVIASKRFTGDYADETYFYRQDIRGSITNIIDKDGTVLLGYTYDAYGNTTETGAPDFINSKAYTGAVSDEITGLYYMNARYYNPANGRFLMQDSVRDGNLYAYCSGDPINFIDPTGHTACNRSSAFVSKYPELYKNIYSFYFKSNGKRKSFYGLSWVIDPVATFRDVCIKALPEGANLMVEYAKRFVGILPYNSSINGNLAVGADCNDFVREIYRAFGYFTNSIGTADLATQAKNWERSKSTNLQRVIFGPGFGWRTSNTNQKLYKSTKITDIDKFISKLQVCDLILFDIAPKRESEYGGTDHVAMYIGNGYIIHERDSAHDCQIINLRDYALSSATEKCYRMPIMALTFLTQTDLNMLRVPYNGGIGIAY